MERPKAAAHQSWLGWFGSVLKAAVPNDEKKKKVELKAHDERLLEPSKGEKKKKRLWQHDSWFIDFPAQFFFHPGVLRKSKAISEFVGSCCIPSANGHSPRTHTQTHTRAQTHGAPSGGGVFNPQIHCHKSNPAPSCPGSSLSMKSSSQWHINSNLQGRSCEEGSINRTSFYFVVPYYFHSPRSHWIGNYRRRALLHHSLRLDVSHVTPFFPTNPLSYYNNVVVSVINVVRNPRNATVQRKKKHALCIRNDIAHFPQLNLELHQYKNLSQYIRLEPSDFMNHIKTSMIKRKMLRKSPSVVSMEMSSITLIILSQFG